MEREILRQYLCSLNSANTRKEKEKLLGEIFIAWKSTWLEEDDIRAALEGNILFKVIAEVIEESVDTWQSSAPFWLTGLLQSAYLYDDLFLLEHKTELLKLLRKQIMANHQYFTNALVFFVRLPSIKQLLLSDDELYNKMKSEVSDNVTVQSFFCNVVEDCAEWQLKVISDTQFVVELLSVYKWEGIFVNLAQHPDAKVLLPPDVLAKACNEASEYCTRIRGLLSNDENNVFELVTDSELVNITNTVHQAPLDTVHATPNENVEHSD